MEDGDLFRGRSSARSPVISARSPMSSRSPAKKPSIRARDNAGSWFSADLHEEDDDARPEDNYRKMLSMRSGSRCITTPWAPPTEEKAINWGDMLRDGHHGPLSFIDTDKCQSIVGAVIFGNAIVIGLETDIQSPDWWWVEQALLAFFVLELSIRALHHGWRFVEPGARLGNFLDVTIVVAGVFDMWLVPGYRLFASYRASAMVANHHAELSGARRLRRHHSLLMTAVGMLRLLRIVRLVRLVRIVPQLYRLASGVIEAMQGMFWVLVFLFLLLYAVSVIFTRLIGQNAEFLSLPRSGEDQSSAWSTTGAAVDLATINEMFGSVFSSMFVLFELMSCWSLMNFLPLFAKVPSMRLFFAVFYIFAAWALLAIMTGVVSERMVAVKEQVTQQDREIAEKRRFVANETLVELFRCTDTDGSGTLSRREFEGMLHRADILRHLLMLAPVINVQDLTELFDWLDHDKNDEIELTEFLEGFIWLNEDLNPKSFVKLQEQVARDLKLFERRALMYVDARFDQVTANVRQPLRKIHAVTEQIQRLDATLSNLEEDVRCNLTRGDLAEMERRLSDRIDSVLGAVEGLAGLKAKGLVKVQPSTDRARSRRTGHSAKS